jgi:hypothetical protein
MGRITLRFVVASVRHPQSFTGWIRLSGGEVFATCRTSNGESYGEPAAALTAHQVTRGIPVHLCCQRSLAILSILVGIEGIEPLGAVEDDTECVLSSEQRQRFPSDGRSYLSTHSRLQPQG